MTRATGVRPEHGRDAGAPRSIERRAVRSLVVLALFAAALGSLAWSWANVRTSSANFGDQEILDGNHLGAGTLDIALGSDTVKFNVVDMAPGDTEAGRLELTNNGTLPLRYGVSASTTGGQIADVLELALWMRTGVTCADREPPTGVAWTRSSRLTTVVAAPQRVLAPGESDVLCMLGRLPLAAPSSAQGQRLTVTVTVAAEHDVEASS